MLKIKDLIINENEIVYIEEFDSESLGIMFKGKDKATFVDAHPEDIEWNYDSQERQYNEETEQLISSLKIKKYKLQDRIKDLEEEHKELVETNYNLATKKTELEEDLEAEKSTSSNLAKRMLKAIEYIEENTTDPEFVVSGELQENQVIELLKILKGEE